MEALNELHSTSRELCKHAQPGVFGALLHRTAELRFDNHDYAVLHLPNGGACTGLA